MHTTQAFIVKKEEYGEADLMLTVLSEQFGKIKVFAKGVRKEGAKLRGHCEPMSKSIITFVVGKNMYRLIHAEVQEFYPGIRRDLVKLQTASRCFALADEYLLEDKDSKDFFRLFENMFSFLEGEGEYTEALREKALIWFECNFLDLLGLFPEASGERGNSEFPFIREVERFRSYPIGRIAQVAFAPEYGTGLTDHLFRSYASFRSGYRGGGNIFLGDAAIES